MKDIIHIANEFRQKLNVVEDGPEFIGGPISVEVPPNSFRPANDIGETLISDINKTSIFLAGDLLVNLQQKLAKVISISLGRSGFSMSPEEINKELLKFGEDNNSEYQLLTNIKKIVNDYGSKASQHLINNLSR